MLELSKIIIFVNPYQWQMQAPELDVLSEDFQALGGLKGGFIHRKNEQSEVGLHGLPPAARKGGVVERGIQVVLFTGILIWIAIFIFFFPKFITVENGQWAGIFLLWLGGLYLEKKVTKSNRMGAIESLRSEHTKSMRVAAESFTINDARGKPWAEFGFHPVDAGQGRPTLTIYDDKGGTIASFSVTEVGRMLEKIQQEMKKMEQMRKRKDDDMIKEMLGE